MEPLEDDYFASRSQRVVQEVITRLAPNVEVVRFRRMEYSPRGNRETVPHESTATFGACH
jgi:hypothetical protein